MEIYIQNWDAKIKIILIGHKNLKISSHKNIPFYGIQQFEVPHKLTAECLVKYLQSNDNTFHSPKSDNLLPQIPNGGSFKS